MKSYKEIFLLKFENVSIKSFTKVDISAAKEFPLEAQRLNPNQSNRAKKGHTICGCVKQSGFCPQMYQCISIICLSPIYVYHCLKKEQDYMKPKPVCLSGQSVVCGLKGPRFYYGQGHVPWLWAHPQWGLCKRQLIDVSLPVMFLTLYPSL